MYQAALDLLRVSRAETLHLTSGMSQEQSEFSPGPGKWSAGEVLDHLLMAEDIYRKIIARLIEMARSGQRAVISSSFSEVNTSLLFIPKSLLTFADVPFTIINMFVPPFAREFMAEFRLFPTQNPDIAQPRGALAIGALRDALRESYKSTATLLSANPSLDYRRMRYRHPLLGDNNVMQVLRIVAFHERRHQSQIRDIARSRHYPRVAQEVMA